MTNTSRRKFFKLAGSTAVIALSPLKITAAASSYPWEILSDGTITSTREVPKGTYTVREFSDWLASLQAD